MMLVRAPMTNFKPTVRVVRLEPPLSAYKSSYHLLSIAGRSQPSNLFHELKTTLTKKWNIISHSVVPLALLILSYYSHCHLPTHPFCKVTLSLDSW